MNSVLRTFLFAAVSLLASVPALAQYPTKPIHIVVPYAAGGGTDIVARMLAGPLREMLGKPVIVDNKPGAGGALGAAEVARATADGYTLLMTAGPGVLPPSLRPHGGRAPAAGVNPAAPGAHHPPIRGSPGARRPRTHSGPLSHAHTR